MNYDIPSFKGDDIIYVNGLIREFYELIHETNATAQQLIKDNKKYDKSSNNRNNHCNN